MKTSSGDVNANISYSCRPEVTPPKGYEHFTIQTRQDLNNSVISIIKYMQLYFISLHLTSGIHEIFYIYVFTFWKEIQRSENLSCYHLQTPDTRTKNLFIGEDFLGAVFILAVVSEVGDHILLAASRSSKEAWRTPPAMMNTKKRSKSEATTSDQTDSNRTHQEEKTSLFTAVFWEKGSSFE